MNLTKLCLFTIIYQFCILTFGVQNINSKTLCIRYVNNLNIKFSFIGISETWATKHYDHLLNIYNYNHEQCIWSNKKRGGGTSLYIHNGIQ